MLLGIAFYYKNNFEKKSKKLQYLFLHEIGFKKIRKLDNKLWFKNWFFFGNYNFPVLNLLLFKHVLRCDFCLKNYPLCNF